MAAYVLAIIEVTDPSGYQEYARQVPTTAAKYGGRYLARGGTLEVKEGDWPARRVAILEFPSLERARQWYDSPEYAPLKAIRQANSRGRIAIVEGLP